MLKKEKTLIRINLITMKIKGWTLFLQCACARYNIIIIPVIHDKFNILAIASCSDYYESELLLGE
jgi:hypothetical protein